ncbi:MAG: hypothetical protein COV47_01505 [Candidatus Diapherotrites archaeon CG11_big_fil_rev_8_21_14_0_20_37_9]|nr:MAG: hypothetical protein COV47_01505 [Candidatus Diapherotrites archaeon CG11_big_fil_rev_8_21_14_0_20_37_9]
MVILIGVLSLSSESVTDLNKKKGEETAQLSVNTLRDAANDVYRQGLGARKKIYYVVPDGTEESASGVNGNTFVLNLYGTDFQALADVTLSGTIPATSGGHEIWLTAYENYVAVGAENLSVDKTSIYVLMTPTDSEQESIIVTNNGSENVTVNGVTSWSHPEITLMMSPSTFALNSGQDQNVTLSFASSSAPETNYIGSIGFGATYITGDDNISVPVNIEVQTEPSEPSGELIIFPPTYSVSLVSGGMDSNSLQVCNNSGATMTNIAFANSGTISSWIGAISTISSLDAGQCTMKAFIVTVPGAQSQGSYTGTITAEDDSLNSDALNLNITVIQGMSDSFVFDWSTASFVSNSKIGEWTIENTAGSAIAIAKVTINEWSKTDLDSSTLNRLRFINDSTYWTGSATDGQEVTLTSDATLAATTSYTQNEFRISPNVNDEFENFQILFTFTDASTYLTNLWPLRYQVDLWGIFADDPQPINFSNDINSTANTFGIDGDLDGWDWKSDVYVNGTDCYEFNADPNDDNSTSDSVVGGDNRLEIRLGDYGPCDTSGTNANAAYGVEFEINSEQYSAIVAGQTASLIFNWGMIDSGVDTGEAGWIKVRFGDSSGMTYLGSNLDSGLDSSNEIYYDAINGIAGSGSESIDVTSLITGAGTYYAEFGGKLGSWNANNEDITIYFDNLDLTID